MKVVLKINFFTFSIISLSLSIVISLMSVDHFIVYMHRKITRLCHSAICTKIGSCLSLYLFYEMELGSQSFNLVSVPLCQVIWAEKTQNIDHAVSEPEMGGENTKY